MKFCCAGLQVSRNSKEVHDHAPFMKNLSKNHWNAISWLMRSTEVCFETINDHQVISHIRHTKKQVHFKTMSTIHHHQWVDLHLDTMDPWHLGVMFHPLSHRPRLHNEYHSGIFTWSGQI